MFILFYLGMILIKLVIFIIGIKSGVLFLVFIEVLFMEIVIEILREVGFRLLKLIGLVMGIVGGLIIGEVVV